MKIHPTTCEFNEWNELSDDIVSWMFSREKIDFIVAEL